MLGFYWILHPLSTKLAMGHRSGDTMYWVQCSWKSSNTFLRCLISHNVSCRKAEEEGDKAATRGGHAVCWIHREAQIRRRRALIYMSSVILLFLLKIEVHANYIQGARLKTRSTASPAFDWLLVFLTLIDCALLSSQSW